MSTLPSRCDPAALEAQLCKPVDSTQQLRRLSRRWTSPDPLLSHLGVRYLQVGGDWWNRCNEGWLNVDSAFANEGLQNYQIGTDDKGGHNMMAIFDAATVLPFRSQSVQMIYSEHMLEHLLPDQGGVNWIKELVRLLVPGGVLQLYGSSSCGLNASGADIDLTIEPAGGAPSHDSQKAIVQELASILGCRSSWAQVAIVSSK